MRRALLLSAALAFGMHAGAAGAETFVAGSVSANTTWGVAPNTCPIILEDVVFVDNGATLTILPGCIVRGQPRSGPTSGGAATAPGALVITQSGKINAVGDPNNPIIFTTAAVDNDNDGIADSTGGFLDQYGGAGSGDVFLDDDPLGAPLAPLNQAGLGNHTLWGGMVILGEAPTNVANNSPALAYGSGVIEGLNITDYAVADISYGGTDPHDSSGALAFASIRHAGDPILPNNELNCLTIGGVGDGTLLSHVECYVNFDDGFEWFGGTVNADHLVANAIADDSFDVDQGFTGTVQFLLALMPTFTCEAAPCTYGSGDQDRGGEFDGDDSDANVRLDVVDGDVDGTCWPLSNPNFWNGTWLGPDTPNNPASVPAVGSEGLEMRNGFNGKVFNSLFMNFDANEAVDANSGGSACTSTVASHLASGSLAVVSSTVANSVAAAGAGTVYGNGDAICASLGAPAGLCANALNPLFGFNGLANPEYGYEPKGVQAGCPGSALCGKLDVSILSNGPMDFRTSGLVGTANGVPAGNWGLENATFRGAFSGPNWLTGSALGSATTSPGWTTLSNAGMVAP